MNLYWTVEVRDPGDILLGISPLVRRFSVEGEEAAWDLYVDAIAHGFEVQAWKTGKFPPS